MTLCTSRVACGHYQVHTLAVTMFGPGGLFMKSNAYVPEGVDGNGRGSVRPKPGFGIGNRNQDQVSVSVSGPELFLPKPKLSPILKSTKNSVQL